jgi:hypothetical protein
MTINNLNDLAVVISKYEGKKQQVNIAQIKEIIKIFRDLLKKNMIPISILFKEND